MRFLRTNTAVRVTVGPFFDKTDGVTPEVALTVTAIKLTFMVDDGNVPTLVLDTNPTASGGNNDMVHVTGDDAGFYDLELTAANTNLLGRAMLALTDAANHCPVFHEFMILPAMIYDSLVLGTDRLDTNVTHIADTSQTARDIGASVLLAADQAVNATKFGGTTVTGRDIGASVLLSPGTGTGQVDITSGVIKANLAQILGTALTETAGQIAAAFKKFFDKATPTGTVNSLPDAVAGAASGLALVGSNVGAATSVTGAVGSVTADVGITQAGADKVWASTTRTLSSFGSLVADVATAVWGAATRLLTAGTNIVLAKGTGITGFNDLSAAQVNTEVDTALADYDGPTHTELTAELATADDATLVAIGALNNLSQADIRTAAGLASADLDTQLATIIAKTDNLPVSPAATGDVPTVAQIAEAMFLQDSGQIYADAVSGSVVKEITDNAAGDIPTASEIAIAVRNNLLGSRDANILFLEAGGASTGGLELYKETSSSVPTIDTSIKPPDGYSSIKLDTSQWVRTNCGGSGKISFYFYTESLPSATEPIILTEDGSGSPDPIIDLRIGPDGLLYWYPVTGDPETAGSQVLSAGTHYRISLCFTDHDATDDLSAKVYINRVLDIAIANQGTNGITAGQFRFMGPNIDGGPFYFGHIYVDDGPDLADTGGIGTVAKFPAAANDDEFDTTGGTGAVNERPLDEANYRQQAGSTQARQNYTLESADAGDVDISGRSIIGVMGWIRAKKSTPLGGAGTPAITVDGVDHAIGGAAITTSPSMIMKPINQLTYPDNAAGIGMVSGGTAVDYTLYECGVVIAFIDPIIPTALAIADAVWDEDIVADHTDTDSAGRKLSQALILYEGS